MALTLTRQTFPFIVVEGPDNGGKTTLAARLSKRLGALYAKLDRLPSSDAAAMVHFEYLHGAGELLKTTVISDRFPTISDFVYGPIIRGNTPLTIGVAKQTWKKMSLIIYCCPPMTDLGQFNTNIQQMPGVIENIEKIQKKYEEFFKENKPYLPPIIRYNYRIDTVDQVHARIVRWFIDQNVTKQS